MRGGKALRPKVMPFPSSFLSSLPPPPSLLLAHPSFFSPLSSHSPLSRSLFCALARMPPSSRLVVVAFRSRPKLFHIAAHLLHFESILHRILGYLGGNPFLGRRLARRIDIRLQLLESLLHILLLQPMLRTRDYEFPILCDISFPLFS